MSFDAQTSRWKIVIPSRKNKSFTIFEYLKFSNQKYLQLIVKVMNIDKSVLKELQSQHKGSQKKVLLHTKNPEQKKRKNTKQKTQLKPRVTPQEYQRFLSYLSKRRRKFLKDKFYQYYGKNFPINYRQDYDFDEQWKNNQHSQKTKIFHETNIQSGFEIWLSILTIIIFTIIIWMNNLIHFFGMNDDTFSIHKWIYIVGLMVQILNGYFKLQKPAWEHALQDKWRIFVRTVWVQLLTLPYFMAKQFIQDKDQPIGWIVIQCGLFVLLYVEASKRYHSLRLMSFCLQYEYQTKLLDMLITIFIVAHFIAIVLFSATKFDAQKNWLAHLDIDKSDGLIVYNYSFYFTVTTIMTVGYGDITPKNRAQVIIVSFVEIFGIIMFGYMINEIGYCISSLRKNSESIDKDLFLVQKLRQHYKMDEELTCKVKCYLLETKPHPNQVLPEEEQSILMKLNEEIREDVIKQNMNAVVRSSIFFICRWTRNFQESISRNLIHITAKPNDILYQPNGKERIYIIRTGKIHIYADRVGSKRGMRTPLKSIQIDSKKAISDNCYGYTAVISSRLSKIYAISKDFTSCYYIEKPVFLESTCEKGQDFQYYHEMKSKIDQDRRCQSSQVPRLESSKHHYNPSVSFLIKRHISDKLGRNQHRNGFKGAKIVHSEDLVIRSSDHYFNSFKTSIKPSESNTENKILESLNNSDDLARFVIERDLNDNLHHYFESSKEYTNYFISSNKEAVLKKYDNRFVLTTNDEVLKAKFSLKMYKEISSKSTPNIPL